MSHRRIRVQAQRRRKPDYRKTSAALQAYVIAQAEADAQAQTHAGPTNRKHHKRAGGQEAS
jgi:hypothetical protein